MIIQHIRIVFFLIFLAIGQTAMALMPVDDSELNSNCSELNLNTQPDTPLRSIPIYDQGSAGTCYAHAAAQLIDYYRFKNGDNHYGLSSPEYLAWSNQKARNETELSQGNAVDVINHIRKTGICSEDNVRIALLDLQINGQIKSSEMIHLIELISQLPSVQQFDKSTLSGCDADPALHWLKLRKLNQQTAVAVYEKIFARCKNELKPVTVPQAEYQLHGTNLDFKKKIDTVLGQNMPIAAGFCSNILTDRNFKGISLPYLRWIIHPDCNLHEVLITARKSFHNRCYYLIRNSYGAKWGNGTPTSCACRFENGDYKDQCMTWEPGFKEFVGCWFEAKDLLDNTQTVTWLK